MLDLKEKKMGRFSVDVDLASNEDLFRADAGLIAENQVRRIRISGLVDSGAMRLVIPPSVVQQLGLKQTGEVDVRYADGRRERRPIVGQIYLTYAGRSSVFNAIVEPDRDTALIGAIVMEDLDLVIDCTSQKLVPRDPNQIISEIE